MSIINQIVSKFQPDFGRAIDEPRARLRAFATDKWSAFWQKHDADEAFRKLMRDTYCYNRKSTFNFWLNSLELREFLRDNLKNAEVILIELNKTSALSLKQVERALSEARDAEEFKKLVLEERASKANIWFELERKLSYVETIALI